MEKIKCPICNGKSVKNGIQNSKQRYKCKVCNKRFLQLARASRS